MTLLPTARARRAGGAASLVALALAACGLAVTTSSAQAAPGPTDVVQRFDASTSTLGAIPDAVGTTPGTRVVDVPVSGVGSTPTDITLSLGITHTWVGDLSVRITAPDGTTSVTVVDRPGVPATVAGDDSDLAGTYTFTEGAATTLDAAAATVPGTNPVAPGTYAPTAADGTTRVSLAPLRSVSTPNGLWRVAVTDSGPLDTGTVTAASLSFATLRSQSPACRTATAAATAAQATAAQATAVVTSAAQALTQARAKVTAARKKLAQAKKSNINRTARATKIAKAKKKVKKARAAASAAQAALTSAQAASTAAQTALTNANATRVSSC